ncbi:hypothetical protein Kpol_2000p14 [Vanderwaltozyma polyspora DSM 70294]|uniref:Cyclin N-terminal domain-containing protein n=1 Tax=Vanderwaltozyma polyspora (strain ATCC 22028 / DSM 70294 / BCRC 21397 / CBS 2163 / NBRC 10782 / NRRL Y-8283 / UCD 57-17) TaxID=436907 RepID=A7TF25_VANPO|nr:uncharacterized protein Kpol_2000p14 [Vanderwaltozyma polyspora DSM 70294]EDO19050.1 hypothetical protein Kpol_2000p14 [Vanderwaltozyma polyspora DSM 70294]
MSQQEALSYFIRQPVSHDMICFLASTTDSIIQLKPSSNEANIPSIFEFIKGLIKHSNVQTSTLMASTVYLTKLRSILPANVYGIESTKHRIFLGCLILAAKSLNDSSPLNKHWTKYTNGLLNLADVNTIERELLAYLNWDTIIKQEDLIGCLSSFLKPIQDKLLLQYHSRSTSNTSRISYNSSQKKFYSNVPNKSSTYVSNSSIPSLLSNSTISTAESLSSISSYNSSSLRDSQNNTNMVTIREDEDKLGDNTKEIFYFKNPDRLPLHDKDVNITQKMSTQSTRPIILKSSFSEKHGGKFTRSGWQSIFH